MLTERDATKRWQMLFRGQPITALTLREAKSLVEELPFDSPVRLRLSTELDEIRILRKKQAKP